VGLYLDTYSQHVWGFKHKVLGSGKTTEDVLVRIFHEFVPPETFMTDGACIFTTRWYVISVLNGAQTLMSFLRTLHG
jgi:hypothetical protein